MGTNPELSAIVLAGGESSRFGSPKPAALFLGRPLLHWVVEAAAVACTSIVVVRANGASRPGLPAAIPVVHAEDAYARSGPLAGIVAGMERSAEGTCFVISCDAPLLRPALIRALAAQLGPRDAVCPRVSGRLQPLAAVYRISATLPRFHDALESGRLRVADAVRGLDVRYVDESELRAADPWLDSFRTANTPAELAALEEYARALPARLPGGAPSLPPAAP